MHPDVDKLMALQREDVEAKRLRDEVTALPRQVAALETRARATQGQRAVVLELIAKEEALRRRQESDIRDLEAKATRARKQMEAATTAVQVKAYEHEIAFAAKEIDRLEDEELASMERSEGIEAQKKIADKAVVDDEARAVKEADRCVATLAADKAALAEIEARRSLLRPTIGEEALSIYDRIARAKGTAVAETWLQKCLACQMMLRPQRWNDLRSSDNTELMTCDSCGRLLWYDPARDSPQRKPVEFESIAAQIVRGR